MSDKHNHYLCDLGKLLLERALEARRDAGTKDSFALGRAIAYYEVVSTMLGQAGVFDIPPAEIGLDGVDPDRDLL